MNYDCHVATGWQVPSSSVGQFLKDSGRRGAVLIEDAAGLDGRRALLDQLKCVPGARGIVHVRGESLMQLDGLDEAGVCGARLVLQEGGSCTDRVEEIELLHEVLPSHWHVELTLSVSMAAKLAALLARMDRRFCLTLRPGRASPQAEDHARIQWWMDMGNAYLKVIPGLTAESPFPPGDARMWSDRMVVGTGWPRSPAAQRLDLPLADDDLDYNAERLYGFRGMMKNNGPKSLSAFAV
jgi:hypothetical protein